MVPYLITKYPLTVEKDRNKNLQASVKSADDSQMVEYDYFFSSSVRVWSECFMGCFLHYFYNLNAGIKPNKIKVYAK
jgi:hypothetical protein